MWKIDSWGFDQSNISDSHVINWQLEILSKQYNWFSYEKWQLREVPNNSIVTYIVFTNTYKNNQQQNVKAFWSKIDNRQKW